VLASVQRGLSGTTRPPNADGAGLASVEASTCVNAAARDESVLAPFVVITMMFKRREDVMPRAQSASSCRWAVPTLTIAGPEWIQAADREWTCTRVVPPEPLLSTDRCSWCPHWRPRPVQEAGPGEDAWPDHVANPMADDIITRPF
jgi:hypothetical protein